MIAARNIAAIPSITNMNSISRCCFRASSRAGSFYSRGRVTVPVLWDKRRGAIVNNESSEIIRMMNSAFNALGAKSGDYYPEELRLEIESVNTRVYDTLNNGVYKG
jgi:glutathionyl-hydroquinone reductase